jgi:hypothetical protein
MPPGRGGADIDVSAVAFDDFLADGQPDAGARVLGGGVQALEDDEDPLGVAGSMPMPSSQTSIRQSGPRAGRRCAPAAPDPCGT